MTNSVTDAAVEAAYRKGHLDGRCGGSGAFVDEDWNAAKGSLLNEVSALKAAEAKLAAQGQEPVGKQWRFKLLSGKWSDWNDGEVRPWVIEDVREYEERTLYTDPQPDRSAVIEEAARVAERHDGQPCTAASAWTESQTQFYSSGQQDASLSIAAAIRAIKVKP